MKPARSVAIAVTACLAFALPAAAQQSARGPAEHVIIQASEAARFYLGFEGHPLPSFWTPTAAQVRALEANLGAYLVSNTPAGSRLRGGVQGYRVQYIGLIRNGVRVIFANFFCNTGGVDFRTQQLIVDDGGDCYFHIEYDPATRDFSRLSLNGDG